MSKGKGIPDLHDVGADPDGVIAPEEGKLGEMARALRGEEGLFGAEPSLSARAQRVVAKGREPDLVQGMYCCRPEKPRGGRPYVGTPPPRRPLR